MALEEHYEITMDWEGKKDAGIDIKWDYAPIHKNRKARLSMDDYTEELLIKVGHTKLINAQLSPYKHTPIVYGARNKFTTNTNTSAPFNAKGILRVQNCWCATRLWLR